MKMSVLNLLKCSMVKPYQLLQLLLMMTVLLFSITSCDQSNGGGATILEGEWRGECTNGPTISNNGIESVNKVIIFKGTSSTTHFNEYSDDSCTVYVKKVITLSLAESDGVNGSFEIGTGIKTSNGVDATKIIYSPYSGSSADIVDIFLLQNNNTTLILGIKCQSFTQVIGGRQCHATTPTELNYAKPYTKFR